MKSVEEMLISPALEPDGSHAPGALLHSQHYGKLAAHFLPVLSFSYMSEQKLLRSHHLWSLSVGAYLFLILWHCSHGSLHVLATSAPWKQSTMQVIALSSGKEVIELDTDSA